MKNLYVLGILAIVILASAGFIVSLNSDNEVTGQATLNKPTFFQKLFGTKPNVADLEPVEDLVDEFPIDQGCKIISQISSDYQWIWDENPTPEEACARENLECRGVFKHDKEVYFDDEYKMQTKNTIGRWVSSHYCNEGAMGVIEAEIVDVESYGYNDPEYSAEPYAGWFDISESIAAVLCC